MNRDQEFLSHLVQANASKLVLLVLDGVGDLRTAAQPATALEVARTPNLDALARRSSLGRLVPVAPGVTPGSGPGHLALFGYDPTSREADIGRGVLEALGLGLELAGGDIAARGNFATVDAQRKLTDRRAGRPPTSEGQRICALMNAALEASPVSGVDVHIYPGEAHRFVLLLRGPGLSAEIGDTDPQQLGVPALPLTADQPAAAATVAKLEAVLAILRRAIAAEPQANEVLLRGFSALPHLPSFHDLYQLRAGAFAGYPLYRGVASACGMKVIPCGKRIGDLIDRVAEHWANYDYFFLHVKQTDQAGEDGDLAAKAAVLEEVDQQLPRLLELQPDVLAITGDHSTPAPMAAHSWHPVPLLLAAELAYVDGTDAFNEEQCIRGHLGTFPARHLVAMMLAHGGRLKKFGA
jgi:2,3-bisphosphoglycerate-independent phosphoglycerate mutase